MIAEVATQGQEYGMLIASGTGLSLARPTVRNMVTLRAAAECIAQKRLGPTFLANAVLIWDR